MDCVLYDNLLEWGYVPGSVAEKYHKKGIEEGVELGIEQGIEQGVELGIVKGIEQGIEQGRQSLLKQSVLHMHRFGQTPDQISILLNISGEQVLSFLNTKSGR